MGGLDSNILFLTSKSVSGGPKVYIDNCIKNLPVNNFIEYLYAEEKYAWDKIKTYKKIGRHLAKKYEGKVDLIHSLGTSLFSIAGSEIARYLELPFLVSVHGLISNEVLYRKRRLKSKFVIYKLLSFYYRKVEKEVLKKSYVITFSNLEKGAILNKLNINIPISVIYHGSDHVSQILTDSKSGVAYIKPTLIKGSDFFFNITKKLPDIVFHVYSTESNKTNENIRFYRHVSQPQFYSMLARHSILIHPSRHDSFSIGALEAMRLGLFPIVSENTGISEIIEKHGSGIVLPLKEELWVEAIRNLEVSEEMRKIVIDTASRYTWKKAVDEHIEVYKKLLK